MRRVWSVFALIGACVGGCADSGSRSGGIDSSLEALAPNKATTTPTLPTGDQLQGQDVGSLATQAALDLQKMLDSGVLDKIPKHEEEKPDGDPPPPTPTEIAGPPVPTVDLTGETKPQVASKDPVLELAEQMAALLKDKKVPDAVALAPIEAMLPGALAELDAPSSALGTKLSPEDRRLLTDARDRILAQPGAANETFARTLARLAPPAALKIGRAELCTRVDGFGRYTPYNTTTFVVGRAVRAIIYVELDGFAARPAREGDPAQRGVGLAEQVSVDLSQRLTLYHDPSGLQAWVVPAKTVIETSRNKRRDFYLIQTIELPATLSIGRYNLKVTVKDNSSGGEAEVVLPIGIVADSSALVTGK